jgi:molecular chaperone HtpG
MEQLLASKSRQQYFNPLNIKNNLAMTMQRGSISVQTENIFPIIKKFLYSDQEIFLRELIANAMDATTKVQTLANRGDITTELTDLRVEVMMDKIEKTITIRDRGIGMTAEEVKKYLNQVAFSSAQEFLDKYKTDGASIIGHFGLGFYSAFMVADTVEVITKSYKEGATAVRWTCDGSPEYTIEEEDIEREIRGTDIILHVSDDAEEFLDENRLNELLTKYCKFLPIAIQFGTRVEDMASEEFPDIITEKSKHGNKSTVEMPNIINNTNPIWKRNPNELTDQDYVNFYQELHPHSPAPLFWVHLNIDYPFNLTGVLYFPKLANTIESQRNKIQLYCNQVFVTDETREIVPEFLTLLHGVIDSPDIPLNVSRSYLQSDRNVKRISEYITRKVGDKLAEIFKKERDIFTTKWESISLFVKYGIVTEEKFAEKAINYALLENTDGQFFTIEEFKEKVSANQTDKDGKLVYLYTNDTETHDTYISAAKEAGYDVLKFDTLIDTHFIQYLERKYDKIGFARVDSDTLNNIISKDIVQESVLSQDEQNAVEAQFKDLISDSKATISLQPLSPQDMPVVITKPEFFRRMKEMSMTQSRDVSQFGDYHNVVINSNHPLIAELVKTPNEAQVKHLYQLARLQQGMLRGAELTDFIKKSINFMK